MFFFSKSFSILYYKASNLLGHFVFVSKNIFQLKLISVSAVRDLGAFFDEHMSMDVFVHKKMCCYSRAT